MGESVHRILSRVIAVVIFLAASMVVVTCGPLKPTVVRQLPPDERAGTILASLEGKPSKGPAEAKVVIVEFSDFQ